MAAKKTTSWAREKKAKARKMLRERMFIALAITARQDAKSANYFHADADDLGVSEKDRQEVANTVFHTLIALAGKEGKRVIDAGWKAGKLEVIR